MPKTAKTIFRTTEKSNFILNMTPESYHRYNLKILMGFLILMPLFSMILEFVKVYSVPGMALSVTGVFAIVFVFIGFMKSETPKTLFLPAGILGAMLVWGLVSLYNSYFYSISLFGADGRNEGWLSLLFYGSFFLLGAQLGTDSNRLKLLHGMFWMGLAECLWSIPQMLPIDFPSYYRNLEPLLLFRVYLPSGLTGSPVFLAILLSVLLIPAMLESIFTENGKHRILDILCVICFSLTAVRTQCLTGIIGIGLSVVFVLIYGLIRKKGKRTAMRTGAAVAAILLGLVWNAVSPSVNQSYSRKSGEAVSVVNAISFYDNAVLWEDSSYRLEVSGYYFENDTSNPNGNFRMDSLAESYGYLWKNTLKIISRFPLAGSGPDSLVYPQLYQSRVVSRNPNTFDRCNNYYLYLAGTMGIPMLILFLVLMILTLIRGGKGCKMNNNWLHISIFSAVVLYLVLMLISSGSITIAPLFWMLAGICISLPESN